ncbi:3-methyladenine DNA glycosylase [Nakamurella panacisegetis]|uniref:3-methyladenine DNA glycosylase n=1 Tax=Nakamurella panacisegetis TaxID=1090615 RepID=UPI0018D30ED5|nr:3-methyladenine DNA glycosylase [Nakamurella panacisegetis]
MTTPGDPHTILHRRSWVEFEQAHAQEVDSITRDHLSRSSANRTHPVEDFLFTYYSLRPSQLRRWYPGAGTALLDAPERTDWRFHRELDIPGEGRANAADVASFLQARGPSVAFIRQLLTRTVAAPPQFGCFGLHEWAMVYRSADDRRHLDWPLRLGSGGTDQVVEDHQIRCSHYDAFRFFTPAARPLNLLAPDLWTRDRMEQPGCLHASMDLYKWAYRLTPLVGSAVLLDCFRLARDVREVDMRASPYDLTGLGYAPITIETPAGKAEYVAAQRAFADRGQALRGRLVDELDSACEGFRLPEVADRVT